MAIIGISLFEKVKLLSLFVNELACLIHVQAKAGVDEPHHYVLSLTTLLSPTPLYFPFTSLRQFLRRNEDLPIACMGMELYSFRLRHSLPIPTDQLRIFYGTNNR